MKKFSSIMSAVLFLMCFVIMAMYEHETINTWQVTVLYIPTLAGFAFFANRAGLFDSRR